MNIHSRIKILRLLCGMTQEELASKAGVPRPSLGNYEQGTYVPRDKSLERLATILDVEPGYLRYGSPVIFSQVWLPTIPVNVRRKRETIEDIINLLPEFVLENHFTGLVTGTLSDGNRTLLFGRQKNFDCLLLTSAEFADRITATVHGLENHTIEDNPFGTLDSFDENCLMFIYSEIEAFGFKLDISPMRQTLTRLAARKTRTVSNLDAVALEYAAKSKKIIRDRLIRVADTICHELLGRTSLEQFVSEQKNNHYLPTLDVSSYSDPVSKTFCIILKAAYDVLASEQKINRSYPTNP